LVQMPVRARGWPADADTCRVFLLDQPARLACCRIKVRKTSFEIPMPPDLAKDFEYSSVSIERQTPVPVVSPNGPSPLTPVVICENIELRNIASNSWALARVFFCASGEILVNASASCGSLRPLISEVFFFEYAPMPLIRLVSITSPRCRPGSHRRP